MSATKTRGPILVTVAGHLYWIVLLASLWVLLRGHNEPGGGFIGGLMAVSASVVLALARGAPAAERRLPLRGPRACALLGVGVSAASGLVGPLVGAPFLTHPWVTVPLWLASFQVSSVVVFDLGVYLCVWGAVGGYALELLALEEPERLVPEASHVAPRGNGPAGPEGSERASLESRGRTRAEDAP